jgi:hypothetical protein
MSRRIYPRCPTCGCDITLAEWRPRSALASVDPADYEFFPARCSDPRCDWQGPKDESAVSEAQARSARRKE